MSPTPQKKKHRGKSFLKNVLMPIRMVGGAVASIGKGIGSGPVDFLASAAIPFSPSFAWRSGFAEMCSNTYCAPFSVACGSNETVTVALSQVPLGLSRRFPARVRPLRTRRTRGIPHSPLSRVPSTHSPRAI